MNGASLDKRIDAALEKSVTRAPDEFMEVFIPSITEVLTEKVTKILKAMTLPIVSQTVSDATQGSSCSQPTGNQPVDVSGSVGNAVAQVKQTEINVSQLQPNVGFPHKASCQMRLFQILVRDERFSEDKT